LPETPWNTNAGIPETGHNGLKSTAITAVDTKQYSQSTIAASVVVAKPPTLPPLHLESRRGRFLCGNGARACKTVLVQSSASATVSGRFRVGRLEEDKGGGIMSCNATVSPHPHTLQVEIQVDLGLVSRTPKNSYDYVSEEYMIEPEMETYGSLNVLSRAKPRAVVQRHALSLLWKKHGPSYKGDIPY
jgi:hypothetical protein